MRRLILRSALCSAIFVAAFAASHYTFPHTKPPSASAQQVSMTPPAFETETPTPTPAATEAPTPTSTPEPPTVEPPSPTATDEAIPTATDTAEATPTATDTVEPSPTPVETTTPVPTPTLPPLNLAMIFGAAFASFYLLEKPLIKLGHRYASPVSQGRGDLS